MKNLDWLTSDKFDGKRLIITNSLVQLLVAQSALSNSINKLEMR